MVDYKKELEEFSYIVSHDLNAPLRHVREFSRLLMDSLEDKISEEEQLYFHYVKNGTDQIEKMIAALLEYSRMNTNISEFREFDFIKMVNKVTEILDGKFTLKTENLPQNFVGDEGHISTLIENLFENSIKFKKSDEQAVIFFEAQKKNDVWQFSIRDQGIGIPENQRENVFKIFKTLNPNDDHAGVGAGLALCKKVVQQHDGKIWIDPDYKDGVQVHFTLLGSC